MSNTQRFYRNGSDLTVDGEFVESGSLWELSSDTGLLQLVDEDRFVCHDLTDNFIVDDH